MNVLAALIFYFLLPETRGKTLEEIAGLFGDNLATEPFDQIDVSDKRTLPVAAHVEESREPKPNV